MALPFRIALPALLMATLAQAEAPATPDAPAKLDLLATLHLADRNDPNLAAVRSSKAATQVNTEIARAVLLPTVVAGASLSRVDLQVPGIASTGGFPATDTRYTSRAMQAKLTQPLFHLDAFYLYQAAQHQYSQAEAQAADQTQNLLLAVSEAYFNVLRAEDVLALAKSQETALAKQREQAQARFEVGLVAQTDVLEAEAQHDAAQARRLTAEVARSSARETLNAALGTRIGELQPLADALPSSPPQPDDADAWVSMARERNPGLVASRLQVQVADEARKAQRAGYLPQIDLFASYSDRDNGNSLFPAVVFQSGTQRIFGVEAQWALFNGGRTAANVRQAELQTETARQQALAREHQVLNQTRTGFLTVKADSARLQAARRARDSAELARQAAQAGYEVGLRSIVDVLLADSNLYAAKRGFADARYDYVINTLRLHAAAGLLNEDLLGRINGWLAE